MTQELMIRFTKLIGNVAHFHNRVVGEITNACICNLKLMSNIDVKQEIWKWSRFGY